MPNDKAGFLAAAAMRPPRRAPYTFVRLNEVVLPSPVPGGEPSHGRPLPDGLSGEIQVRWTVETPLLIGGRSNNEPVRLGADYILPGASLRGMIRSVMEIVAFARLNFVDDGRFGLRDYEHLTWQKKVQPPGRERQSNAGWLEKRGKEYWLIPVIWEPISITDLCTAANIPTANNCIAWHCMDLPSRMAALEAITPPLSGEIDLGRVSASSAERHGHLVVAGEVKSEIERRNTERGRPTNKLTEAAFISDTEGPPQLISSAAFEAFDLSQARGETNWTYWRAKLMAGERIPVFYRGNPARAEVGCPPASDFFMSLTRLHRVHFDRTVHDLVGKTQVRGPGDTELDLVEALFGWVPPKTPENSPREWVGRQKPWRGRVFFHHAEPAGCTPTLTDEIKGVTMQPRASFYPFYLRPQADSPATHPVDYDNEHARLAGRKRYPARNEAARRLPQAPPGPGAEAQTVRLRFLQATPQRPLTFRSRIRLHNVTLEELGALVWAITFGWYGQNGGGFRHMLGRAKAFGYGQVRAEITGASLECNNGDPAPTCAKAMTEFETWVLAELKKHNVTVTRFADLPEIKDLLAAAHAPTGHGLREHLRFTESDGNNEAERTLKGYQRLRHLSGHGNAGQNPGKAGQSAAVEPTDERFVGLPGYPWDGLS